jgi:FtsH-binding integral membrane protein
VPRFVSFMSWLIIAIAAAFLVVATAAFSLATITAFAFAIGIGTLLVSSVIAYYSRAHVASVTTAVLVALISAWTVVASLVFAQSTVQHIALASSLAIGALAVVGLTVHEVSLERAVPAAKDEPVEREAGLAAAA